MINDKNKFDYNFEGSETLKIIDRAKPHDDSELAGLSEDDYDYYDADAVISIRYMHKKRGEEDLVCSRRHLVLAYHDEYQELTILNTYDREHYEIKGTISMRYVFDDDDSRTYLDEILRTLEEGYNFGFVAAEVLRDLQPSGPAALMDEVTANL